MTKDELIAKQQLEIEMLKKRLKWARKDKSDIVSALVCIGGPLNATVGGFSPKQRSYLHLNILQPAEAEDHEYIEELD